MAKVEWVRYNPKIHDQTGIEYDQLFVDDAWMGYVQAQGNGYYAAYTWDDRERRWVVTYRDKSLDEAVALLQTLVILGGTT